MRPVSLLLLLTIAPAIHAERVTLRGIEKVSARQKTLDWCWAAALETIARAQRVNLSQEQIVRAALEWICRRLPKAEQGLLLRLSGYGTGWAPGPSAALIAHEWADLRPHPSCHLPGR